MINKSVYRLVMHVIFALGHQKKEINKNLWPSLLSFSTSWFHMRFLYVDFLFPPSLTLSWLLRQQKLRIWWGEKEIFLNVANPTFDKKEDEGGGGFFQPVAIFQQCSGDFQIITLAWRTASW